MVEINEPLSGAARAGSEVGLKDLLREPGCKALVQSGDGMTALMHAAFYGYEGCVRLLRPASDALTQGENGRALMRAAKSGSEGCVHILLPASDASAKDREGLTASMWGLNRGHKSLAQFIDAYAWAQSERAALEIASSPERTLGRAALRV